jgi:hypothetical protein
LHKPYASDLEYCSKLHHDKEKRMIEEKRREDDRRGEIEGEERKDER